MQSVSVSSTAMYDASWPLCYCMLPYYNKSPPIHPVKQVLVNVATEKFSAEIEAEASICMPQYYMEE